MADKQAVHNRRKREDVLVSQFEKAIRHEVSIQRLASEIVASQINPAMLNLNELVRRLMLDYSEDMTNREFNALRTRTEKQLRKALNEMWSGVTKELEDMAVYEADYQQKISSSLTGEAFAAVSAKIAVESANKELLNLTTGDKKQIGFWPEFIAGNTDAAAKLVDAEIRAGMADKLTNSQILTRLVGKKKNNYEDGMINKFPKRWAKTLVNTGVSHYANAARKAVDEANKDLIEGLVFSSVLDNRTSETCLHYGQLAKQGKVYKIGDPLTPYPPLHPNCRSILIRKLKGIDPFAGTQAAVGAQSGAAETFAEKQARTDKKFKYRGKKDLDVFEPKQIDAHVSPQEFYERQPMWYLESTLGKTKAQLFKKGGLPIEKFADTYGLPLTIKQMRELDEYDIYFDRAGL